MSAAGLARQLGVPTNRITGIINGQRAITGDTALRPGHFFGTSPEFWLNLQNLYELRRAEQKAGKSIKILPTLKKQLYQLIPQSALGAVADRRKSQWRELAHTATQWLLLCAVIGRNDNARSTWSTLHAAPH